MNWIRRSIAAKLILAVVLLCAVTVGVAVVGLHESQKSSGLAEWVTHTHEVLGSLERVLSGVKDAETGQRGYLLTGNEDYLEPYSNAVEQVTDELARIKTLTSDNADQQRRIESIEPFMIHVDADSPDPALRELVDLR